MNKPAFGILLLAVGGGAYLYYNSAKTFGKDLSFDIKSVSFDANRSKATLYTNLYITVTLNVFNPTTFAVTVNSIAFELTYQGNSIATAQSNNTYNIPANSVVPVTFNLDISALSVVADIPSIIEEYSATKSIAASIDGEITASTGTLTIQKDIVIS
jgi:LEA14-like dessication related protein